MLSPIIEAVGDPSSGNLQPAMLARLLNIPLESLADLTRSHRNTLSRSPQSPQVQVGLSNIVRILVAAAALMDGASSVGRAVLWFRNQPIQGLGGKTAMELVRDGRASEVMKHLEMLEDGIYS